MDTLYFLFNLWESRKSSGESVILLHIAQSCHTLHKSISRGTHIYSRESQAIIEQYHSIQIEKLYKMHEEKEKK